MSQTVDHLFDCLVPDDSEVTKQPWWSPEDPKKPNMVTPSQCLCFAAEKYIRNQNQRPIDEDKTRDTVLEMLSIIRAWVDSIVDSIIETVN